MKTQQRDQVAQQNGREHQQFGDLIGKQVMHALGEPSDLRACKFNIYGQTTTESLIFVDDDDLAFLPAHVHAELSG